MQLPRVTTASTLEAHVLRSLRFKTTVIFVIRAYEIYIKNNVAKLEAMLER